MKAKLECKKFPGIERMSSEGEYVECIGERMVLMAFCTGESMIKVDALQRMIDFILFKRCESTYADILGISRAYILDWDRAVRARVFNLMGCLINSVSEVTFESFSIHVLTMVRLESSKSSVERVSILRFISKWLNLTKMESVYDHIVSSLAELVIAHSAAQPAGSLSQFYETILRIIIAAPHLLSSKSPRILARTLNAVHAHASTSQQHELLDSLLSTCTRMGKSVRLNEEVLSPKFIDYLAGSDTGISILLASTSANTFKRMEVQSCILALISRLPLRQGGSLVSAIASVPDLPGELIRDIFQDSTDQTVVDFLYVVHRGSDPKLETLLVVYGKRLPMQTMGRIRNLFRASTFAKRPLPPEFEVLDIPLCELQIPRLRKADGIVLNDEERKVFDEVMSLASLVQFKTKSANLTQIRQSNPSIFQSVPLWFSVYDRTLKGSFNLAARRVIHSLFVHTLCSPDALAELDLLKSSSLLDQS